MQYYIKIFNANTGEFVGYYKSINKNCVTSFIKGTRFFNDYNEALDTMKTLDGGFLRDKDKHYYTCKCVIYCDSYREPKEVTYKRMNEWEEEKQDAINAIIRESGNTDSG